MAKKKKKPVKKKKRRVNSDAKGKEGEREATYFLRKLGFEDAKRTQQYRGDQGDAADVECVDSLPNIHIEVKYALIGISVTSALLRDAVAQARRDCPSDKWWCVLWRAKGCPHWCLTFDTGEFGVVTITDYDRIRGHLAWVNKYIDDVITATREE